MEGLVDFALYLRAQLQPSIGDGVQADPVRLRLAQLNGSPKEKQMLSSGMSLRSALRPPAAVAQTAAYCLTTARLQLVGSNVSLFGRSAWRSRA
ncbi:unnamed protein product [Arctogadus glacialis]